MIKPREQSTEDILFRNMDGRVDPEVVTEQAILQYGERLTQPVAIGSERNHNYGILTLLLVAYGHGSPERFGEEFARYFSRHKDRAASEITSTRRILKRHLTKESTGYR